ncbi:MAG: gamma-glutamyl-gamma-aminobutyrate hydrolase family protein [Alistipes sp.]|nr:gamma-glutamyl-gamma-aminobutyrate hydrolase family protein [Candidatus Alistipes equi]
MRIRLILIVILTALMLPSVTEAKKKNSQKPLIGVLSSEYKKRSSASSTYIEAVRRAGGIPVVIPMLEKEDLHLVLKHMDAILLPGGEDVAPERYGEKPEPKLGKVTPIRDEFDIAAIKVAYQYHLPILGICRGEQVLNVAFGGSLHQDLPTTNPSSTINHRQQEPGSKTTHLVKVTKGTHLHSILGCEELPVNTHHHQAVKDLAPGFTISAVSEDGVVEAIENFSHGFILGVQFHPEKLLNSDGGEKYLPIFQNFVKAAKKRKK